MTRISRKQQGGYALILVVLGLMGVGGVVLGGFTQDVKRQSDHQRYLHNERVLKEAKQALLQYAYNYPTQFPDRGPGRLPCPDTDDDGDAENPFDCINGDAIVGRLPWNEDDLNLYDIRDASGERLWYALSRNFARSNSAGDGINSSTIGTITVEDRTGALLHDGTLTASTALLPDGTLSPLTGAVAVIIAPGPQITRDDGVAQNRADDPNDPVNYLDSFGSRDNAEFVNNDANGFVTGPIVNPIDGSLLVNDQIIVITAAEVAEMAEMATLQAYRDQIQAYLASTSGVYPWLFDYTDVDSIAELSEEFTYDTNFGSSPDYHDNYGRIPSIFANYFRPNASRPIESPLNVAINFDFRNQLADIGGGVFAFNAYQPRNFRFTVPVSGVIDALKFNYVNDTTVFIDTDLGSPAISTSAWLYFWDEDESDPTGFWTMCPDDGDGVSELSDCHRKSTSCTYLGNPVDNCPDPGGANEAREEIMRVNFKVTVPASVDFEVNYDANSPPTSTVKKASATDHAFIEASIDAADLVTTGSVQYITVEANYQIDRHYHDGDSFEIQETGSRVATDLLDGGSKMTFEMVYYPELPRWAYDNGWHNAVRMAFADTYEPGVSTPCEPTPDADPTNDCLFLPEEQGAPRNKASLLVIAGEHDWLESDSPADGLANEIRDVFDNGNHNDNRSFYDRRAISASNSQQGNDRILVIEEL